jgi:hypothetical protein
LENTFQFSIKIKNQPGTARPYLEKPFTKTGLVEWLKVKSLSSSPTTGKKKREREIKNHHQIVSNKKTA